MEKIYKLTTESACIWDGELYFVPRESPVLCKWDLKNGDYEIIAEIPEKNVIKERLFDGMCVLDGVLILAPYNAEKIWTYNIGLKSWKSIDLNGICELGMNAKYVGCCAYDGYVYFFGYAATNIIRINLMGKIELVEIKNGGTKGSFWGQSVTVCDGKIMVANLKERGICQIDTNKATAEYIKMPDELSESCGVTHSDKALYLAPYKGNKFCAIDDNQRLKITLLPEEYSADKNLFNGVVASKDAIVLFSPLGESLIIHKSENECTFEKYGFIRYATYDENIGFVICGMGYMEIFDDDMTTKCKLTTEMNEEQYIGLKGKNGLSNGLYQENSNFGLSEMLAVMSLR